jgi:hypothetical protein
MLCSEELWIGRGGFIVLSSCQPLDIASFWQEYWNKAGIITFGPLCSCCWKLPWVFFLVFLLSYCHNGPCLQVGLMGASFFPVMSKITTFFLQVVFPIDRSKYRLLYQQQSWLLNLTHVKLTFCFSIDLWDTALVQNEILDTLVVSFVSWIENIWVKC